MQYQDDGIVPWAKQPLTLADLGRVRLVGYDSTLPLSNVVLRYVTTLYVASETLRAPLYEGDVLEAMLSQMRHWPSEDALLAHVHACLFELASKAYLYYHGIVLGTCAIEFDRVDAKSRGKPTAVADAGWPMPSGRRTSTASANAEVAAQAYGEQRSVSADTALPPTECRTKLQMASEDVQIIQVPMRRAPLPGAARRS